MTRSLPEHHVLASTVMTTRLSISRTEPKELEHFSFALQGTSRKELIGTIAVLSDMAFLAEFRKQILVQGLDSSLMTPELTTFILTILRDSNQEIALQNTIKTIEE